MTILLEDLWHAECWGHDGDLWRVSFYSVLTFTDVPTPLREHSGDHAQSRFSGKRRGPDGSHSLPFFPSSVGTVVLVST